MQALITGKGCVFSKFALSDKSEIFRITVINKYIKNENVTIKANNA